MTDHPLSPETVRKNRKAGTPGRWLYDGHTGVMASGSVDTYGGGVFGRIASSQRTEQRDGDGRTWMVAGSAEANAARIACVPELEAHYLASRPALEAAERLAEAVNNWAECDYEHEVDGVISDLEAALAAYRKARKDMTND